MTKQNVTKENLEAEIAGTEQLKDEDMDSVAGGALAYASVNTKTSAAPICHGSICCKILGR